MPGITDTRNFIGLNEFSKDKNLWKAAVAEFIGTFLLVFVGCGSCLEGLSLSGKASVPQIAFAFGLVVATMVQSLGHVSGGHINPAVTCGFLVARQISLVRAAIYIVVQCVGAIAGAATLAGLVENAIDNGLGVTEPNYSVNGGQAFGVELFVTFVLVMTVLGVCDDEREDVNGSKPLAIGLAVTACHLAFVPVTGSSMNPARSFGPAVIANMWNLHWVYWIGPISGGILASLVYTYVFKAIKEQPNEIVIRTISSHRSN